MKIHLWGTDFRRSSAELRRSLYIEQSKKERRILALLKRGFSDLVYLNTCNRIEFYTTAKDYFTDTRPLWIELLTEFGLSEEAFYLGYQLEGKSALRHLLRVASSLESLVVGEPQILGQLRDGVRWTISQNLPVSASLKRAFQLAFETAKLVRTHTAIAEGSVSVMSLAMEHLERMEMDYPLSSVAVVGRGPMSVQAVNWMRERRPKTPITWITREPESFSTDVVDGGIRVESLPAFLESPSLFSHLITASGSSSPLFDEAFFHRVSSRSPVVFDLAEPPDVAPLPVGSRVRVVRLEDLKVLAQKNSENRKVAVAAAEVLINTAIRDFFQEQKEAPVLRDFAVVESKLLEDVENMLGELDGNRLSVDCVRVWSEKLVKKNLHTARIELKKILKVVADSEAVAASQRNLEV